MKFLLLTTALLTSLLLGPTAVHAHSNSEVSVEINGQRGTPNKISQSIPADNFVITEEIFQNIFLLGEPVTIALVSTEEGHPAPDTNVNWDTGDLAGRFTGPVISFVPEKKGSFPITVTFPQANGELASHSTLVSVANELNYNRNKPTVLVNKNAIEDLETARELDLNKEIIFSVRSPASTNKYLWNMDNGDVVEGAEISYKFPPGTYLATPILRVTDENGTYTDLQFTLKNFANSQDAQFLGNRNLLLAGVVVVLLLLLGGFILAKRFLLKLKN